MLNYKPSAEDLELRRRTHARLIEARLAMGSQYILHPCNALRKKAAK